MTREVSRLSHHVLSPRVWCGPIVWTGFLALLWLGAWGGLASSEAMAQSTKPDLFIGSLAVNPTVGPPGGNVDLTFELRNGGQGDAGPFNVSVYFSTQATLDTTKATLLKSLVITGLKAGQSSIQRVTVTIPKQASVNQISYLGVMADSGKTLAESNESNNATTTTFNVKPGPDMTLDAVTLSRGVVVPGERITLSYTLKNIGRANASPFVVYTYWSGDALIDSRDTRLDTVSVQSLRVANSLKLSRSIYIPRNATVNQTYFIAISIDPNNQRPEEDETNNVKFVQIKVVPTSPKKFPDFTITSYTLTDKAKPVGERAYYKVVIANQGQAAGYFYLYWDYGLTQNFRTYKSSRVVYRAQLQPGQTYTVSTYFQVPWESPYNVTPKDYHIRMRITGDTESSTTNNTKVLTFKALPGKSNLTYSSFSYPNQCNYQLDSNSRVLLTKPLTGTLSIRNSGYITSSAFKVSVYLSDDNKLESSDLLVATFDMPAIGAQGSVTKNISFTFLNKLPRDGYYRVGLIVDPTNSVKSDYGTGTRYVWMHRGSQFLFSKTLPDLTIDKMVLTPASTTGVGTRINFEIWTRNKASQGVNRSCIHRTWSRMFFADDAKLTQVRFSSNYFTFPTSTVNRITGYIDVPGTLAPRKGFLAFSMDTSNVHLDADESDNIKVVPYELTPRSVDLEIKSSKADQTIIPWEKTVKVDIALNNKGTLKQVTSTRTCVWFSYDQKLEKQDVSLGSIYVDFRRTPSLTGSMTFNAQRWNEGKAFLILQVDCDNRYKESDETNNYTSIPITIRKFNVDFVPISIAAAPNHIRPGLSTTIKIEVQNKGKDRHIKRIAVCLYFSNDNKFDTKDATVSCQYTTDIYDHIGTATFTLTGSASYLAGTRYVFAEIDSGYYYYYRTRRYTAPKYDESDETNNFASIPIYVRNDVDVTTGSLSVSKTIAKVGDNLSFRFQIKNVGTVSTNTPFDVMVVFSDNEVIEKTDRLIRKIRLPALAAGKTSTDFTVSYAIPKTVQPGERYFGLIIDSGGEVIEVDETNNLGLVKVNVLVPGIDLQVREGRLDRSVVPAGKSAKVLVYSEIQNFGVSASPAFNVGFYLSTDKLFDPGDTLLKTRQYTKTLPSTARTGQFVDEVTLTLKQANVFYILVVADPANKIREANKTNNTRAMAIQIINSQPRITTRPPVRAIERQLYVYQAQGFDPDNDPLTWRLAKAPGGMLVDAKTGKISWTPQAFHGGRTYDVGLEVSDGRGGVGKQDFKVSVQSVNDAPKIVSIAPARALAGKAFTYAPRAIDPDPNEVLTWVLINAPSGIQIDGKTGKLTWLVPNGLAGQKVAVKIQVSDQGGLSDTQSFSLLVSRQNSAPTIISTAPTQAYVSTTFRYQALASDADTGDTLTWSRVAGPTTLSIDSTSGLVTWKVPIGIQSQQVKVTIRVSDQVGSFADQSFSLVIKRNNNPPTIISKAPRVAFVNRAFAYVPKASDPDQGDRLSWTLVKGPAGMIFDQTKAAVTWTPGLTYKDKTVSVTIQVLDTGSAKDTQTFSLFVGQRCEVDSDCPSTQLCLEKVCRAPGCFTAGCKDPAKPICGADGTCGPDTCQGITCTGGEFCEQGQCVPVCAYVTCAKGQQCVGGKCQNDPCDGVNCASGQRCEAGKCVRDACANGKCQNKRVCVNGFCGPDTCANIRCPDSRMRCVISPLSGTPQCILPKPCAVDAECKGGLICVGGTCVAPNCFDPKQPCPSGEICLRGKCQADPCAQVSCRKNQFCRDGICVDVCAGVTCPTGRVCRDGRCIADPCSAANCAKDEVCVNGRCETNRCALSTACKYNRVCAGNACQMDGCTFVKCPVSSQRCVRGQCIDPPSCRLDHECPQDQLCVGGKCAPSNCDPSTPCQSGKICRDGRCVGNPCTNKTCPAGTYCREGACVGSCAGVFCAQGKRCVFGLCRTDSCATANCAKDEVCVRGQCRKDFCAQNAKPCKQGRVCTPDGCLDSSCGQASCPKGQLCDRATGQCSGDVSCNTDLDCSASAICQGGKCVPAGCYLQTCAKGKVCLQGLCRENPCTNANCPQGQYCDRQGKCRLPCNCPKGQRCGPNGCEADPCDGVSCKASEACVEGKCYDRCQGISCKFGRVCTAGQGCQPDPCRWVTCPTATVCRRGYCSDACSELTCPTGTVCQAGQCVAFSPEPEPAEEPVAEPTPEPTPEPEPTVADEGPSQEITQGDAGAGADEATTIEQGSASGVEKKADKGISIPETVPGGEGCACDSQNSPFRSGWPWMLALFACLGFRIRRRSTHR